MHARSHICGALHNIIICVYVHALSFFPPVLSGYQLSPREHIVSVTSCTLGSTATPMFAVGTAFVDPTEKEPNRGRTMLFRATHTSMNSMCIYSASHKKKLLFQH